MSVGMQRNSSQTGSRKQHRLQEYVVATGVGFIVVIALSGIAMLPGLGGVSRVLMPGMLLAALIFPEGQESNWAEIYVMVALIIDALFFGAPIWWFWIRYLKTSKDEGDK